MKLSADEVNVVRRQCDDMGMTYASKYMIRCSIENSVNGRLEKNQLFPHLQNIIEKLPGHFDSRDTNTVLASN